MSRKNIFFRDKGIHHLLLPSVFLVREITEDGETAHFLTDQGGFIPTRDEFDELVVRVYEGYDGLIDSGSVEMTNTYLLDKHTNGSRGPHKKEPRKLKSGYGFSLG